MNETDCRICHREGIMSARGLCPFCESLAEIVKKNLDGAARSKRKPPKKCPPCSTCGVTMKPVLFRPDGRWTFYCDNGLGCRWCTECNREHLYNEPCPREELLRSSPATWTEKNITAGDRARFQ
jgi:hypothetical protein